MADPAILGVPDASRQGSDRCGRHSPIGDTDNDYLNHAVYLAESFLKATTSPTYGGEVDYGAPPGADLKSWRY
jgi:hypothetical protein